MKKSIFILGAALAVLALCSGLISCSKKAAATADGASSSAQKVVRINYQTGNLCGAPVHVAWKLGLFDEELAKIGQKAEYVVVVEGGATLAEMIINSLA